MQIDQLQSILLQDSLLELWRRGEERRPGQVDLHRLRISFRGSKSVPTKVYERCAVSQMQIHHDDQVVARKAGPGWARRRFGRAHGSKLGPRLRAISLRATELLPRLRPLARLGNTSRTHISQHRPLRAPRPPRRVKIRQAARMRGSGESDDSDDFYQETSSRAGKAVSARRGGGKRKRGAGAGRGAVACQSCRLSKVC